jgi:hypothetical protein
MSKAKSIDFSRLLTAVESSIRKMKTPRDKRVEAIKQFVGFHYSDDGSPNVVPTNLLELAVTIYVRRLASRAPRALITSSVRSLRAMARNMALALNQIPGEIGLDGTLRKAVIEAIFSPLAVVKIGLADSDHVILDQRYGEPFVDLVTLDDYFVDMTAKNFETIQFEGNDYWLPLDVARDMKGDDKLQADEYSVTGDQGETRAESISQDESLDLYADKVWVRDVWIPDTRQLVTYGVKTKEEFAVVDWEGQIAGPYHKLWFSDVPGNLLALPPVAIMRDLHELANSLFRKLANQAEAKKNVAAFAGDAGDDVKALQTASDGDGISYHGQKPENITVGGIDAPTLAFFLQTRDLFSYFSGNLDSLGGLSPVADTLGQDTMLSEAASARLEFMSDRTIDFARGVYRSLAWYLWTDPVRKRTLEKPVDGTDITIRTVWSPETRDGDFLDYNFDIDIYSMQSDTPSVKLQKIGQVLERYIYPVLPLLQQQGGQIDFRALLDLIGSLANIPELSELVTFGEPPEEQAAAGNPSPTTMPAHTTRTYERVNRPGATRSGKDDVMSRVLMGAGVQGSEMAAMGRRTG